MLREEPYGFGGEKIDEVYRGLKGIRSVRERDCGMVEEGEAVLEDVAVPVLGETIVFECVRWQGLCSIPSEARYWVKARHSPPLLEKTVVMQWQNLFSTSKRK